VEQARAEAHDREMLENIRANLRRKTAAGELFVDDGINLSGMECAQ
jgi:hypothetical protein